MASLRDMVSEYQDDLRNGIAWLAFWREGRSWQAEAFHLDLDDTLYPEDRARLAEIQAADPRAVVVKRLLFRLSGRGNERGGTGCRCASPLRQRPEQHYPIHGGPQRRTTAGCIRGSTGKSPCCRTALSMNAPTEGRHRPVHL